MDYTKNIWSNGENGNTPITDSKLNTIETGIHNAVYHTVVGNSIPANGTGANELFFQTDTTTLPGKIMTIIKNKSNILLMWAKNILMTNGTTVEDAINSKQPSVTGAATTIVGSNLTASRALVSDGSGKVGTSVTTLAELAHMSGVTSGVQTQLNNKQAGIVGAATTISASNLTANKALIANGSGKVAVSPVSVTELGYLSGTTGALQTQINTKFNSANVLDTLASIGANVTSGKGAGALAVKELNSKLVVEDKSLVGVGTSYMYLNDKSGYALINAYCHADNFLSVEVRAIRQNSNSGVYTILFTANVASGANYAMRLVWVKK